ncbi:DNA repair protein RecO [Chondromyces apiculatus]|uniref:DNA repair protein RecO n=1 Tax=Chondromyces apiculatus DSM 436 TaxID=1192034 RepID=A0A017T026_9BACT|nr:DNA repair protein RecO [Chondromyces apiculatus]EYF02372.1 DNA recombination and repair protein RecO [Chondromyces apiculatus DSM 436]
MARPLRRRAERLRTSALLLRRVPVGEADLIATFFTEERGLLAAVARGARRSTKRFGGLEPMHLLRLELDERAGADLAGLVEASIERPRLHLTADLPRLDAAGRALRWVRDITPAHIAEPDVWRELNRLLDELDTPPGAPTSPEHPPLTPDAVLVVAGLRFLNAFGWGLDLGRCVRCGRTCDPGTSAYADPARGGLVCRACGGGRLLLRAELRERLADLASGGEGAIAPDDLRTALDLVEGALTAHASGGAGT